MGKAYGNHLLRGKIGTLIYRVRDGKQQVYLAPHSTKHKTHTWHRPGVNHYRLNIEEFMGAAALGGEIHRNLHLTTKESPNESTNLGPVFRPYSHNLIVARLKEHADYATKSRYHAQHGHRVRIYARQFLFRDAVRALKGLNLSHDGAPVQHIHMTPVGPQHNPTAVKITGFHQAAATIPTNGNSRLECRIHIRQSEFAEYSIAPGAKEWVRHENKDPNGSRFSGSTHPSEHRESEWIPVQIIPKDGLTIDLPEWKEWEKHVTAIIVEWREIRTVGRKIKPLPNQAVVRIVCLHAPAEAFQDPDAENIRNWEAQIQEAKQPNTLQIDWETNPEQYLKAALTRLQT